MSFFTEPFRVLWRHRVLLYLTTRNDVRARFAGSWLGLAWLFFYPLLFLAMYSVVYLFIYRLRFGMERTYEFVILIFCGLIPFLGFSEGLALGTPSVTNNSNLIRNTLFPIEIIPVKAVLVSQCTQVVGLFLLLVVLGAAGKLTEWALLLPVIWAAQLLFTIGTVWILAGLNVGIRDLANMIRIITLMLMLVSPIAYTADMVPARMQALLLFNPLYYMITSYRESLMLGRFPDGTAFWGLLVFGLLLFWAGFWFFSRLKRVFADYV